MIDPMIMQSASNSHDQIRKVIFGVSQNIFHDATSFDTRNGMFNLDPNL